MPKICLGEDGFVRLGPGPEAARNEILRFAREEGFRGVELHAQFESYDVASAETMKEHYASFGLEIPGLQTGHVGFFHPPISEDDGTRKEYVEGVLEAQKFAEALGARHCTLTPPNFFSEMSKDYDGILDRYLEVVELVVLNAEEHHVVMAIEPEPNLILNGGTVRDSIEDVKEVLHKIRSKNLAILYDIAHVNILSHGDPIGYLRELNGRVSWVHVADNDFTLSPLGTGKHLTLGEGGVDMAALFCAMKEEVPNIEWLQIDTWEHPDPFMAARESRRKLEQVLKKIDW